MTKAKPKPLKEVKWDDRRDYYSMEDISRITMRTTHTLFRMIRSKKLKKAEHVLQNGKTRLWKKPYIHEWLDSEPFTRMNQAHRTADARRNLLISLEQQFGQSEMAILHKASKALACDPSFFIWEAAIHKAERVLELKASTPSVFTRW